MEFKRKTKVLSLLVENIVASAHQPRKLFDQAELESLARSIAQNGLLTPITVRPAERGQYQLVAGERRLRAFKLLGYSHIPALLERFDDETAAVMTFIENLHRKNLNCFEEAEGISRLMQSTGYTQSKMCALLDLSQPAVANKMRLLKLEPAVREIAMSAAFGERLCRALLPLTTEELRIKACNHIAKQQLNTAQAEQYISKLLEQTPKKAQMIAKVGDTRFIFKSFDKVVGQLQQLGIELTTQKTEQDGYVCYTIRVAKPHTTRQ